MNSAVQTSGVQSTSPDLGMSPLQIAALRFFGMGLFGAALGGIAAMSGGGTAGVLVVILMLPWSLYMLYMGIRLLVLLLTGGGSSFRRSKAAVSDGLLNVSYYIKGEDHIVVVDEAGKKLCVNGDVFEFNQLKNLNCETGNNKHRLAFVLTSGANPIRNVDLHNDNDLKIAFERLSNSLGYR